MLNSQKHTNQTPQNKNPHKHKQQKQPKKQVKHKLTPTINPNNTNHPKLQQKRVKYT